MSSEEILLNLAEIFQDFFDKEELVITESTSPNDLNEWDSLMHIKLISAIENEFEIKFEMDDIFQMKSVGDFMSRVAALLDAKA